MSAKTMIKRNLTRWSITILLTVCMLITSCGKAASDDTLEASQALEEEQDEAVETEEITEEASETAEEADETGADEEGTAEPDKETDQGESFQEILYEYKEAQDGKYSIEQVEEMGLWTELVQQGWPYAVTGDEVRYLYHDVDDDGNDELIITYYNEITDIWGYDGEKADMAYSTPYRGITVLHPDGMLKLDYSVTANDSNTTWYQYDPELGKYFAVFEDTFSGGDTNEYYTFSYYDLDEESHKEVVDSYRENGSCPVWIYEWDDKISREEYEKLVPSTAPVDLPEGELLSDITLPDDYVSVLSSRQEAREKADEEHNAIQADLNLFLSNFAEQRMKYYKESLSDLYLDRIGYFALMWSYINKPSDVKIDGDYYVVTYDTVRRLAERYFGLEITRDDLKDKETPDSYFGWFYKNGEFYSPAADGESYPSFAVVTSVIDKDEDTMMIRFAVYDLDMDIFMDNDEKIPAKYYAMTAEEAAASSDLTQTGTGSANVKKDGDSYRLQYYQLD